MDSQLPPNQELPQPQPQPQITLEQLQQMKILARQQAVEQVRSQQQIEPPPKIIYVRRNLTVAELIAVFAISSFVVLGIPASWNFITNYLPRIEVKVN